jgi:hypothetical protein
LYVSVNVVLLLLIDIGIRSQGQYLNAVLFASDQVSEDEKQLSIYSFNSINMKRSLKISIKKIKIVALKVSRVITEMLIIILEQIHSVIHLWLYRLLLYLGLFFLFS